MLRLAHSCAVAALLLLAGAACDQAASQSSYARQALPASMTSSADLKGGRSKLSLDLSIPFPVIAEIIGKLPEKYREIGQTEPCQTALLPDCNYNYDLWFSRGKITLARDDEDLKISFRVSVGGDVRIRPAKEGSWAAPIAGRLRYEKVAGELDVSIRIKFAIKSDWCPTWSVDEELEWSKRPRFSIPGYDVVDLGDPIKGRMAEVFSTLSTGNAKEATCGTIREKVSALWRGYSVAFDYLDRPYYFNVKPEKADLYGARVDDQHLRLGISLEGRASVSEEEIKPSNSPLPRVNIIKSVENELEIAAPIAIPLARFESDLARAVSTLALPAHISGFKLRVDTVHTRRESGTLKSKLEITLQHESEPIRGIPGEVSLSAAPMLDEKTGSLSFQFPEMPLVRLFGEETAKYFGGLAGELQQAIRRELARLAGIPITEHLMGIVSQFERDIRSAVGGVGISFQLADTNLRVNGPIAYHARELRFMAILRGKPRVVIDKHVAGWLMCADDTPYLNMPVPLAQAAAT